MALGDGASNSETDAGRQALARLKEREEILQICYWYPVSYTHLTLPTNSRV